MNLSNEIVKIKKPHLCFSCTRKFLEGTKMFKWASIYEGDFCSGYTCLTCDKLMTLFPSDEGYPEGYVNEILADRGFKFRAITPEAFLEAFENKKQAV